VTEHGTRATYRHGCRCLRCRAANAAYRPSAPIVLVSADAARAYLLALKAKGIGARQVAALSGVSIAQVRRVRAGEVTQIRPATASRLLAVKPIPAAGVLVPSWPCRRLLDGLKREGFTRTDLAKRFRIPQRTPPGAKVRVGTALKVRAVYQAMECGVEEAMAG
jgi:hypothetical protein